MPGYLTPRTAVASRFARVDRLVDMRSADTIVIGGGLAGLSAAASLARSGRRVTVLEGAEHLGGRARSRHVDGYDLNLGPHALYRAAGGARVLRDLGVELAGRQPRLLRAGAYVGGEVVSWTRLVRRGVHQRARLAALLGGLGAGRAGALAGHPASSWIESTLDDPGARAVAASVLRTATYSADLDRLDAGAAARQLRAAMRGVLYLDGGWSRLVDQLADLVVASGGEIVTGVRASTIEHDYRVRAVHVVGGGTIETDAVVIAVTDPARALALMDGRGTDRFAATVAETVPVRMAHLDVALRPLPAPRFPNVLGIDMPLYLTVQSDVAAVAPPGGAVIHVGKYLRPSEEGGDHRAELESMLDVAQPAWRDHVVNARYVPRSLVSGDHARLDTDGTTGRPTVDALGVDGLMLAGDWIGPNGMIGDAAICSGAAAAARLHSGVRRPAVLSR